MESRVTIKNHLGEISRLIAGFETFAGGNSVPRRIVAKFNIVLDEILSNVISYAYRDDKEHEIEVQMELHDDRLAITVIDDGVAFNPLSVEGPDTATPLEERELGGMGIHLVRNLMDHVSYHRRIDKNVLTLVKRYAHDEA